MEFAPDFIYCIGGGSSLDTAKAVNLLSKHPEVKCLADVNEVLFTQEGDIYSVTGAEGKLPCGCSYYPE